MIRWLHVWLKYLIAGQELEELERYRLAVGDIERWNSRIPASAQTAAWIRKQASGNEPSPGIAEFRSTLLQGESSQRLH
jgi:hypothetical protein